MGQSEAGERDARLGGDRLKVKTSSLFDTTEKGELVEGRTATI